MILLNYIASIKWREWGYDFMSQFLSWTEKYLK
jgi:hypothetical protein